MAAALTSPTPMSHASEVTHRRTATVYWDRVGPIGTALLAMPDVLFAVTTCQPDGTATYTVECGTGRLPDVAAVFRELGQVDARA